MKKNPILCLLLALAMMLTLTACQIDIPGVGTVRISDGSKNDHDADGPPAGNSYDTSLVQLREEAMDLPSYLFAAAYIGQLGGRPRRSGASPAGVGAHGGAGAVCPVSVRPEYPP